MINDPLNFVLTIIGGLLVYGILRGIVVWAQKIDLRPPL